MALMFELSGEHPVLPASEVLGALEAEGAKVTSKVQGPGVLVVEGEGVDLGMVPVLVSRLALTKRISHFLFSCHPNEVVERGREMVLDGETFCVRARCVQGLALGRDAKRLERNLGAVLSEHSKVRLDHPDQVVQVVLSDLAYVGMVIEELEGDFERRKPQYRPFFSPISLHPKLARALVNLARAPTRGSVLDPFCGTGGILMEAGLMDMLPLAGDLNEDMIDGTERNLRHFGVEDYHLFNGDVKDVPEWIGSLEGGIRVDAVATDPPYGRSTRTYGDDLDRVYEKAFIAMSEVLAPGRYMAMVMPGPMVPMVKRMVGFELVGHYPYRVHRSLTRHFFVFRRV